MKIVTQRDCLSLVHNTPRVASRRLVSKEAVSDTTRRDVLDRIFSYSSVSCQKWPPLTRDDATRGVL